MSSNTKTARRRRRFERRWQRRNRLEKSYEVLQEQAESSVNQLRPETEPEDLEHLRYDLLAWGQYFLPHHFKEPPSQMHIEVAAILDADCRREKELRAAEA